MDHLTALRETLDRMLEDIDHSLIAIDGLDDIPPRLEWMKTRFDSIYQKICLELRTYGQIEHVELLPELEWAWQQIQEMEGKYHTRERMEEE